jgi:hypothetical protein
MIVFKLDKPRVTLVGRNFIELAKIFSIAGFFEYSLNSDWRIIDKRA